MTDRRVFQDPSTLFAGLALAPINKKFLLEIAGRTIGADEVAQCGSTALDGIRQDVFHCISQTPITLQRDLPASRNGLIPARCRLSAA